MNLGGFFLNHHTREGDDPGGRTSGAVMRKVMDSVAKRAVLTSPSHVSMVRLSHSMVMAACSASASRLVAAREISLVFHSVHRAVRYTAELPPLKYSSNDPLDGGEGKRRACLRQGNAGLRRR